MSFDNNSTVKEQIERYRKSKAPVIPTSLAPFRTPPGVPDIPADYNEQQKTLLFGWHANYFLHEVRVKRGPVTIEDLEYAAYLQTQQFESFFPPLEHAVSNGRLKSGCVAMNSYYDQYSFDDVLPSIQKRYADDRKGNQSKSKSVKRSSKSTNLHDDTSKHEKDVDAD